MGAKPTLYELLRVTPTAMLAELQAGYRSQLRALEDARADMSGEAFEQRSQLLRVALNTLADPASRLAYDQNLPGARARGALSELALVPVAEAAPGTEAQAEALALRADALALRADSLLIRAGARPADGGTARAVGSATLSGLKYLTRAIGLLVLVAVAAFALTRCAVGGSGDRRIAQEAKAREQTALQEYYQTHGVRPANMAELELLEADRRRRENASRQGDQDREKQERDARRFEEDSRRRGDQVSDALRAAEERARWEAERDKDRQLREAETKRQQEQAERDRLEQQQREWRETLRR